MGLLFLSTPPNPVCSLCATSRAPTTCTTTLLPSLADPGGAFDAPKVKCPPDRGSSDCVTGSPASGLSTSPPSPYLSKSNNILIPKQHPNFSNPSRPIPCPRASFSRIDPDLSTPPLTPDDGSDFGSLEPGSPPTVSRKEENDTLEFLISLFPQQGIRALPYAKKVSISAPNLGAAFGGVVLELPGQPKTFYVDGKSAESVSLRESIVALLDLADERLGCSALVIALERSSPNLGALLHSLMYVGGSVVTKPVYKANPAYVLVGLEI